MAIALLQTETKSGRSLLPGWTMDRERVELFLTTLLSKPDGQRLGPVPLAMEYAVLGEAQRIRPILALRLARMLQCETEHTLRAAAAVELIHSASLMIDDLPCMDNETIRRGRLAAHLQFGEPTAILGAFSMVALAARIVMEAAASDAECLRLRRFQLALLSTLDCSSLVGGQSMDLTLVGEARHEMRATVNDLKTVPLFQLAVEAGCVSHAAGVPEDLGSFARNFGVAFQLTDDYLDGEFENPEPLHQAYELCRASLQPYGANAEPLLELVEYLAERAEIQSRSHR